MKHELERWGNPDSVDLIRLPEGESGLSPKQSLTVRRLEAIAEWFAIPTEARDPKDILGLARALGVAPASIRRWQKDKRMLERVREKARDYATYLMPDLIWSQYKIGMSRGDTRAASFVLGVSGMGPVHGQAPTVQVNTQVNVGQGDTDRLDDLAMEEVNQIVERRARARAVHAEANVRRNDLPTPGNQGTEAVEALQPNTQDRAIPPVDGSD